MSRHKKELSFFTATVPKRKQNLHVLDTAVQLVSKLTMKSVRNAALNLGTMLSKKTIPTVWILSKTKYPTSGTHVVWVTNV